MGKNCREGVPHRYKRGFGCGMNRSLNIPETNRVVWETVLDVCARSSTLKEEVKRRLLGGRNDANTAQERIEKAQRKMRQVERELKRVDEAAALLETNRLLKKTNEALYPKILANIEAEKEKCKLAFKEAELNLHYETNQKKWIDWVRQFGQEIESKRLWSDEEKREYLKGVLKRIDVKYDKKTNGHELLLTFERPLVRDAIEWNDPNDKGQGYIVKQGNFERSVSVRSGRKPRRMNNALPPLEAVRVQWSSHKGGLIRGQTAMLCNP